MSLLDERALTAAEREAIGDEPRPGVWIEECNSPPNDNGDIFADSHGDARILDQHETDSLIAYELLDCVLVGADRARLREIVTLASPIQLAYSNVTAATQQRGGLHSEPLVRLIAYRAWGNRDRAHDLVKLRATIDLLADLHRVSRSAVISDLMRLGDGGPLVSYFLATLMTRYRAEETSRREIERAFTEASRALRGFAQPMQRLGQLLGRFGIKPG